MEATTSSEALRQKGRLGRFSDHAGRNASERYMRYSAYSVLWPVPRYALHEPYPFVEPRPSRVSAAHNGLCLQ